MTRVYFFRGKHPMYESFLTSPPPGVEYLPAAKPSGAEEYDLYSSSHSLFRRVADVAFAGLGIPRIVPVVGRYDLVHSSRGFIPVGPNPFVIDVEHASSFVGMVHSRLQPGYTRAVITKFLTSRKCRAILPHSLAARNTIALLTGESAVHEKATVLYPAVEASLFPERQSLTEPPHILFMGEFYWKGGREVLAACSELAKRLDFKLTYISLRVHPPESVIGNAAEGMNLDYIEGPISRRKLINLVYPTVDIFAMPTYIDTFGFAFLEAMACGIPCVGATHFAVPEIVQDGITGLTVRPPISFFDVNGLGHPELIPELVNSQETVNELMTALTKLIESPRLRLTMGANAIREVRDGRFSVRRRNEILREVYECAMSS